MYLLAPTADSLKHLVQKQRCSLQRISVKFIYLKYIIVLWDNLSSFSLKIGLHVCDRNKRKTNIWKNQVATPHFWERFLQIADPCLFLWELPRREPKCPQQRSDIQPQALRICKKRTQKVLMFATLILLNICFSFISVTYTWSLFKPPHNVYVKRYWLMIFVFINRR